jgi:hypothetical protein
MFIRHAENPILPAREADWKTVHTANPDLLRRGALEPGPEGAWDEGAIWFGTLERVGDTYYLWYEGGGGGGELCRNQAYGGYGLTSRSQIGLATSSSLP